MNTMNAASTTKFYLLLLVSIAPSCLWALKFEIPKELREEVAEQKAAEAAELEAEYETLQGGETEAVEPAEATMEFVVEATAVEAEPVDTSPAEVEIIEATPEEEVTPEEVAALGRIAGQVFDKETGQPLRGVAIVVADTDFGTISDSQGRYRLSKIPVGSYTLSFIKSGFLEANITDTVVVAGEVKQLDFAMPPRPVDMSDEVYELQDFTVSADEVVSQNVALLALRQQSIASIDALSSESLTRFAASDAAEALTKITGVSISDGKYAVIRGLNDRYNTTLLNGKRFPSPDPDRKAVPMDLFPSSMIQSVVTRKTFTADQPGESSGGSIDIITKGFPDEPFVSFSASRGQQDGLGELLVDPEADYDLAGILSGFSDIGFDVEIDPTTNALSPAPQNYSNSGALVVDGGQIVDIKPVNNPYEVPENWPKFQPILRSADQDESYKIALGNSYQIPRLNDATLGFFWGGSLYKKSRAKTKISNFNNFEGSEVYLGKIKETTYGSIERGLSSALSLGLGYGISELKYNNIYIQLEESDASISTSRSYDKGVFDPLNDLSTGASIYTMQRTLELHQLDYDLAPEIWGLEPFINLFYARSFSTQDEPDGRFYSSMELDSTFPSPHPGLTPTRLDRSTDQTNTSTGISFKLPLLDGRLEFKAGHSQEGSIRNFRQAQWQFDPNLNNLISLDPDYLAANLWQPNRWLEAGGGYAFNQGPTYIFESKIPQLYGRVGINDLNTLLLNYNYVFNPLLGQYEQLTGAQELTQSDLVVRPDGSLALPDSHPNPNIGSPIVHAPYSMNDQYGGIALTLAKGEMNLESNYMSSTFTISKGYKLDAGLRVENFDLNYQDDDTFPGVIVGSPDFIINDIYEPNDSYVAGSAGASLQPGFKDFDEKDYLPSLTFIMEPIEGLSIRASWSETVARPTYREIAPFVSFNPTDDIVEFGNPGMVFIGNPNAVSIPELGDGPTRSGIALPILSFDRNGQSFYKSDSSGTIRNPQYDLDNDYSGLEMSDVENVDLRIEYTTGEQLFAVSFFRKTVVDPIEQIALAPPGAVGASYLYTYINNENKAAIKGLELELQTRLTDNFTIGGNVTLIDAKVGRSQLEQKIAEGEQDLTNAFKSLGSERALFDQPERLANCFLSYELPNLGSRITLSGTLTGKQLKTVGTASSHPDLYLDELFKLNLVFEQKLSDTWSLKFAAKNINKPKPSISYDADIYEALAAAGNTIGNLVNTTYAREVTEPSYSLSISAKF